MGIVQWGNIWTRKVFVGATRVLATWGIRSKKELKDSSHRSCSLLSTHQTNDDMVLVRLFSS
jgi:hypothetical protein